MKSRQLKRVLIANRGEIAVRIIRTLRDMDITSIAVFSEPDRTSLHVLLADEAYALGPGPPSESYLNVDRVIATAHRAGADAIHPGYGFLAERADFARACADSRFTFIGPRPETIELLGDKMAARSLAQAAGVPVVPGSQSPLATLDQARAAAESLGFPILLKAAAGGGGKGMRTVREVAQLEAAWSLTQGEAQSSFGDSRVYLERAIERPRHIEAQILADRDGRVACLGERECSVQRRHQKLVEETPAPELDSETRAQVADAAQRIVQQARYLNAGTVEFILDSSGKLYFLEVNTRLQVEHPVTEMVTGIDLVAEQLKIAAGAPLLDGGSIPEPRGWSIEARVIAENPEANFAPSAGRIERLRLPEGPGIRNDSGIYRGYEIPLYYDSLLTKLVAWGKNREQARKRLLRALHEFVLDGVHNNIAFLRWLVTHPEFAAGRLHTRFLEEHFTAGIAPEDETAEVAVLAAVLHARDERLRVSVPASDRGERSAWKWGVPSTRDREDGRSRR